MSTLIGIRERPFGFERPVQRTGSLQDGNCDYTCLNDVLLTACLGRVSQPVPAVRSELRVKTTVCRDGRLLILHAMVGLWAIVHYHQRVFT